MPEAPRPYRIFLSGNCQMQFVFDALRLLYREVPELSLNFRASYRASGAGGTAAARACDLHIFQVTNLAPDPWREAVPARAQRLRLPALQLPGVFHAFAPRVHPDHLLRGRQPYYLARGNRVLDAFALRQRQGEAADRLVAEYLAYEGPEVATAPRLFEMNLVAMRRIARQCDVDPWRAIEPHLAARRFFWSVKHPTLALGILLLQGVLDALPIGFDPAAVAALAAGPEYHEPYHAPIHPRLAERLGLDWARAATRYRFFQDYFTAGEHARRYISGGFRREFALNEAIRDARAGGNTAETAALFRAHRADFPPHGQAHFWYGRVLQRLGRDAVAAAQYREGLAAARRCPHPVAHRADVSAARVAAWLRRCRGDGGATGNAGPGAERDVALWPARIARLEAQEARLLAQIRWYEARQRLLALRQRAAPPPV